MARFAFHRLAGLALAVYVAGLAPADIVNGDFETGDLSGWLTDGPVFARTTELSRDFLPPIHPDWLPHQGSYFASVWSTDNGAPPTASAFLFQSFEGHTGDTLSLAYFFDYGKLVAWGRDTATATLHWSSGDRTLVSINTPGNFLGDNANIDWTPTSFVLPANDTYTLTFTIADGAGGDMGFESILGVDNVVLTPVPEPATILLLAIGLMGAMRQLRSRLN